MTNSTIDPDDRDRFDAVGTEWWDSEGPMKPLHLFTPVRIDFILEAISKAGLASPISATPLKGISALDIGCGGGLLCEPLARLGANMTGIDASSEAIRAATHHAETSGLSIDYHQTSSEELALSGKQYDLVYASEVIEHVADRPLFLNAMARLLRPGGVFVLTTINRTMPALAFAKFAMEYVVRIIPKGTHEFSKFVKPSELRSECAAVGLETNRITGFAPTPTGRFITTPVKAINYGISGQRKS